MSHSKRNTSLPHFTAYERSLLRSTWGTQRARLSRDSFLPFSSCRLCLLPAQEPAVACAVNGDIFCRECAVNNLLAQHKEIKRIEKERALAESQRAEQDEKLLEEARKRELKEFELVSMGQNVKKRKQEGDNERPENKRIDVDAARKGKQGFALDEEEMRRIAREQIEKAKRELEQEKVWQAETSKSNLPSFWVPTLTPSVEAPEEKRRKITPICPASSSDNEHTYSLKTLVTVHFTEEKDDETKEVTRICPACRKGLTNGSRAILTKPCGHVLCKTCVEYFMKPHENPDPHAKETGNKSKRGRILCYVCETDVTERKKPKKENGKENVRPGLVSINSEGTGFAGGGQSVAQRVGTAFQC
ncbi:hypothetical protein KEM55_004078 [Ascosphaera atra]|nr:hypothetical protein KEM55_004078 [Ascosphaera atra]